MKRLLTCWLRRRTPSFPLATSSNLLEMSLVRISERKARATAAYREVTDWRKLPRWARWCLGSSAGLMLLVIYVVQGLSDSCFESFEVTDSLEEKLGGNALNLLKPLGVKAVYMFSLSCALLWYFQHWAKGLVKRQGRAAAAGEYEGNPIAGEDMTGTHTWREQILKERGATKPGMVKKRRA